MRNVSTVILSAVNTASQLGTIAVDANQLINMSLQTIMGDVTAAGTITVQASNDLPPNGERAGFVPTHWSDVPNATSTVAAGVAPLIVLSNLAVQWVRVNYTRTSGGTTTVTVVLNGVGM